VGSDCEQFVSGQHAALSRAAFLLTGDAVAAQDLVQEALVRVLVQWRKVQRADVPEAYARRILLTTFLGGRRRAWHREQPQADPPDRAGTSPYEAVDDLDGLRRALLALPPRQRAAVVLRHYEDLSEAQTAELLGCSVGNVKALTSRGLAALRLAMGAPEGTTAR
jgi:RNA polymerase sigma-70 factor (sigma-E family)